MKKSFAITIVIIAAAVVAFFSFFWPLNKSDDLRGTIGGVEKAKKFRGEQPMSKEVLLENEDFVALTQSAEWQNAMKNEEFVAFLKSDDFQKSILLMSDMKNLVWANVCYEAVFNSDINNLKIPEEALKSVLSNDFQYSILIMIQDFQQFVYSHDDAATATFPDALRSILKNQLKNGAAFSTEMQKFVASQNFDKMFSSPQFEQLSPFINGWAQDFQNVIIPLSQDFQNTLNWAQDFQNIILQLSQDFQKQIMSQEFQNALFANNADFQKLLYRSQNFQKAYMSQNMQQLVNNDNFQKLVLNQDFQQNMLGAFQDYLNAPGPPF